MTDSRRGSESELPTAAAKPKRRASASSARKPASKAKVPAKAAATKSPKRATAKPKAPAASSTRAPASKAKPKSAATGRLKNRSSTAASTEVPAARTDGTDTKSDFEQAWELAVAAATARRNKQPDMETAELYKQLLRDKCLRAGTLGAATSVASLVPGLGTIASFAIDGIGDAAFTAKLQQELALTTFALHGRKPNEKERLRIVGWIATFGVGGSELIEQVGKMVARQLAKNFAGRLLRRGLPFAEVAYSTAMHLAGTYFVGRRAQLYCIGLSDAEAEILLESEKGVKLQVRRMKKLAQESVEAMEERFGMPGRTLAILFRKLTGQDKA